MEVVYSKTISSDPTALKHRGSGLSFKDLFLGDPHDIPNNYYFVLASQSSFYSPKHKHNFDQFRFVTKGTISILPTLDVAQGELCYHPEGVPYGPQDDGEGLREVLVLQFGGASGQGFLSHAQLKAAQEKLSQRGKFEKGKYFEEGKEGGEGMDSFQALWEDTMGRPLVYPKGRYGSVIKMTPENYEWQEVRGSEGVWKKNLGVFSEREARAEMWKVRGGSWKIDAEDATQLFLVLNGQGQLDGKALEEEAAIRLQPGTGAVMTSDQSIEAIRFVLPVLRDQRQKNANGTDGH